MPRRTELGYDREKGWFSEEAQRKILDFEEKYGAKKWPTGPRYSESARLNRATQPVVGVSWYEAAAYAEWLSETLRQAGEIGSEDNVQLATEAEWTRACGGAEGRGYSWGGDFDPRRANTKEGGLNQPTPVHMYPCGTTPEGVFDLTGNVWEWTAIEAGEGVYVLAGGSWWERAKSVGASARRRGGWFSGLDDIGFRLVVVPISPES